MCPAPRGTDARPQPAAGAGGACRRAQRAAPASRAPGSRPPAQRHAPPSRWGHGLDGLPARAQTLPAQSPGHGPGAYFGGLGRAGDCRGGGRGAGEERRGEERRSGDTEKNTVKETEGRGERAAPPATITPSTLPTERWLHLRSSF